MRRPWRCAGWCLRRSTATTQSSRCSITRETLSRKVWDLYMSCGFLGCTGMAISITMTTSLLQPRQRSCPLLLSRGHSEALNSRFVLRTKRMLSWTRGCTPKKARAKNFTQQAWNQLSRTMRFARMSCDFLNNIVARSYFCGKSGRLSYIFGTCLWHRDIPAALNAYKNLLGAPDRGSAYPRQWTFRAGFLREHVALIKDGDWLCCGLGLANGYRVLLALQRGRGAVAEVWCTLIGPYVTTEGRLRGHEDGVDFLSGVLIGCALRVEDDRYVSECVIQPLPAPMGTVIPDVSSWEEFIAEDSPYFRGDVCHVKVTLRFFKDAEWNRLGHSDGWYESDGELS